MIAVLLTTSKNISVGIYLDIYNFIWFRLVMMIDTTDLYILILVSVTLSLILGHRHIMWKQNFCTNYLQKF